MTMEKLKSPELPKIDLTKVTALQQKRTLAFVNHFLVTTVQFMNNFSKTCEQKLMQFERKLEKVNAAMVLLESRLSSIPEVNTEELQPVEVSADVKNQDTIDTSSVNIIPEELPDQPKPKETVTEQIPLSPEYERFVKMAKVGVPLDAVKLKASLEGLDPNLLEKLIK